MDPIRVTVRRGEVVESTHDVHAVAVRDGAVVAEAGDTGRVAFLRSSAKPFQALPLVRIRADLTTEEIAIASASHLASPEQLAAVRSLLAKAPAEVDELECGSEPTPLEHNCSGKHAGMLATCVANGWPLTGYLDPGHPVQVACQQAIERLSGERVRQVAVDGCGAPQHALTLRGLARAYGALASAGTDNAGRTAAAMRDHPWHVGGTGRDVTDLMAGIPGLVAKDGAEGVYAAGLPDGSAVALKIDDGASRARPPLMVAALRHLGVSAPVLDQLAVGQVLGGGRPVGEVRVIADALP